MHETLELGVLLLANYSYEESMACELESRLGRCYTLLPSPICINVVIQKYPAAQWELWQYVCPACARLCTLCILHCALCSSVAMSQ